MKRMKKYESELGKLQGQKLTLEQQEGLIQGAQFDKGVMNAMTGSKQAIDSL